MLPIDRFDAMAVAERCSTSPPPDVADFAERAMRRAIALDAEPWTPENDMVTAAFKLKRANIYERFRGAIDGMYAGGGR